MLKKYNINPTYDMVNGTWSNEGVIYLDDRDELSFDRAAQGQAKNAASTAGSTGASYGATANQIGGDLIPYEERELNNPTGFTADQMNSMLAAGEQGAGGAAGGITGEANLEAARTRNTSGFSNALDKAAETKEQNLSENALGVANENANLEQQKQQQAASALGSLYGTDTEAQLKSMGLEDQDINSEIQAGQSGWLQNTMGVINSLGSAATGAANVKNAWK